jgi:hypothetical protein
MKRVVRSAVIAAVVITAVTAAFAMAETGRYPSVKQIPTVVTSQRVTEPVSAEAQVAAPTPIKPKASSGSPSGSSGSGGSVAGKSASGGQTGSGAATRKSTTAKKSTTAPASSTHKSGEVRKTEREVVNRKVRDESDEHPSSESGSGSDQPKTTSDSENKTPDESPAKN